MLKDCHSNIIKMCWILPVSTHRHIYPNQNFPIKISSHRSSSRAKLFWWENSDFRINVRMSWNRHNSIKNSPIAILVIWWNNWKRINLWDVFKTESKMELFAKLVNYFQLLTIFANKLHLRCSTGFWILVWIYW